MRRLNSVSIAIGTRGFSSAPRRKSRGAPSWIPGVNFEERCQEIRDSKFWIFDMDGVIYRGEELIEGVHQCIEWLRAEGKEFRFLTNNSKATPKSLSQKMAHLGVPDLDEKIFWTAAMSTASFLMHQRPLGATAYVVGGEGLHLALAETGVIKEHDGESSEIPDYVVIGEADHYRTYALRQATKFVHKGAILIGTNQDVADPVENDMIEPSCGAWCAVVERSTEKTAYYVGKPNPLNLRALLEREDWHSEDCVMIGDRMSTDIIGAMEANIKSVLVLSGLTRAEDVVKYPFRPSLILQHVGKIPPP